MTDRSQFPVEDDNVDTRNDTLQDQEPTTTERSEVAGEDSSEYDPHQHRHIKAPTTNFESLIHVIKCAIGTGILAMPQAFANAGLITGLVATALIGVMLTHCLKVLITVQYEICKRKRVPFLSYPQSMAAAFESAPGWLQKYSRSGGVFVDALIIIYQVGVGCIYVLFIARTVKILVDPIFTMAIEIYCLITIAPLILIMLVPNLKILAPFNLVAIILTFLGLGIVMYFLFTLPRTTKPLDYWGSPDKFALFFGTVMFALTSIGVIINVEYNMETPKAFVQCFGVLDIGMAFSTLWYMIIGALGYVHCAEDCKESISFNMPEDHVATKIMWVAYMISILISYALQCSVVMEMLWDQKYKLKLEKSSSRRKMILWEYMFRIGLCFVTFIIAVVVPALGLIISLFGALCLSILGMILPTFMQILINSPKPPMGMLIKNIVLIIIGFVGLVVGVTLSVVELVKFRM